MSAFKMTLFVGMFSSFLSAFLLQSFPLLIVSCVMLTIAYSIVILLNFLDGDL